MLSKPMAVSLPVVLVLLDIYPLRRLEYRPAAWLAPPARRVWLEKAPFVLLSAGVCAVTLVAYFGRGALAQTPYVGWPVRLAVAVYALAYYLWKTVTPWGLSPANELVLPFDPIAWPFLLSAAVVAGITLAAVALRKRWPALLTVWLVYVGVLLPVLGLVQYQNMIASDRYTYLACLGWALLGGWAFSRAWKLGADRAGSLLRPAIAAVAIVVLAILGALTWKQSQIWHDTERLFEHALAVREVPMAHLALGKLNYERGRYTEGIQHLQRALALYPDYPNAYFSLGMIYQAQGRLGEAAGAFRRALELKPDLNVVSARLGDLLLNQGRWAEAEEMFRALLNRDPTFPEAHNNLGVILDRQDRLDEAIRHFRRAVDLNPGYAAARYNLGNALMRLGRWSEAAEQLGQAVDLNPGLADAQNSLGVALAQQGKVGEAIEHFQAALRLDPAHDEARANLRIAKAQQSRAPGRP